MLFLTTRLEKDHFFLKLGLEFQLQLSGHPVLSLNILVDNILVKKYVFDCSNTLTFI